MHPLSVPVLVTKPKWEQTSSETVLLFGSLLVVVVASVFLPTLAAKEQQGV